MTAKNTAAAPAATGTADTNERRQSREQGQTITAPAEAQAPIVPNVANMTLEEIKAELPKAEARYQNSFDVYTIKRNHEAYRDMERDSARATALRNELERREYLIEEIRISKTTNGKTRYSFTASEKTRSILNGFVCSNLDLNGIEESFYCLLFEGFERLEQRNNMLAEY